MKAAVTMKNDWYIITDLATSKKIYTIRRISFKTGIYQLVNASKYKLYTLMKEQMPGKPSFSISNNGVVLMRAVCKSMFFDPEITVKGRTNNGEEISFALQSKDRQEFKIICGNVVCGSIKTNMSMANELQYDLEIDDKYFDDYVVFFPAIIDLSFSQFHKDN